MLSQDDLIETIGYFVEESREALDQCEPMLVMLDGRNGPADAKTISAIYRLFHGMKGNAGFLQLNTLVALTHRAETVLGHLRDGKMSGTPEMVDVLIRTCDVLRKRVEHAATAHADAPEDETDRRLMHELTGLVSPPSELPAPSPSVVAAPTPAPTPIAPKSETVPPPAAAPTPAPVPVVTTVAPEIEHANAPIWFQTLAALRSQRTEKKRSSAVPATPPAAAATQPDAPRKSASLRVDVDKLDQLMDLVGELIIAGTAVAHHPLTRDDRYEDLNKSVAHLTRTMRGLQDVALSVRMVPIEPTFRKMIRLVHDVSQKQGKRANLELAGAETEVDKAVAELIGDPLVHLLRNAVDHGLETTDERVAKGKPAAGTLKLSASHHGGEVRIRIEDDGRGLSRDRIVEKAIQNGLVDRARAATLRDEEVWGFIFEPGFSTAAQVTDISGRGVGMDVVKKNIEAMKGRIDVRTVPGHGTTFTLRIPLTLAIVDGLLVRVGESVFTIPLPGIRESVVVSARDVTHLADGEELVRIRNEMVPVLRLQKQYAISGDRERLEEGVLVIVEEGGNALGLFADELLGQRQTVIKPMGAFLGDVPAVAGCTVLGDGRVSLILDVPGLMARARGNDRTGGAHA